MGSPKSIVKSRIWGYSENPSHGQSNPNREDPDA